MPALLARAAIAAVAAGFLLSLSAPPAAPAGEALRVGPVAVRGDEAPSLLLGVGAFDVFEGRSRGTEGRTVEGRVELALGRKLLFLEPRLGFAATGRDSFFGWGGVALHLALGRWSFWPAGGVAGYRRGSGKNLGDELLLMGGLTAGYRLPGDWYAGLAFSHLSNGFRHDRNPGAESLLAIVRVPLGAAP